MSDVVLLLSASEGRLRIGTRVERATFRTQSKTGTAIHGAFNRTARFCLKAT
jgi:hypothetical protein